MTQTVIAYFLYSVGILFREGVEALLVVVALAASTREMGSRSKTRQVYAGAALAVLASIALAWGVNHLISDDASDTMEGIFQLLAAATLFYVSSWLTSKNQAESWKQFISAKIDGARESRLPGIALGLTAFLAVIREGAETIVFFQALTAGATEAIEQNAVALGIVAATILLAITMFALNRAADRIPFSKFFYVTSVLLYGLAVVFVGQGVASLQEADMIGASFVDHVPTIAALGIFPTVQSLGAQALLLGFAALALLIPRGSDRQEREAGEVSPRPEVRPTA